MNATDRRWTAVLLPGLDGTGRLFGPLTTHLPQVVTPKVVAFPENPAMGYEELIEHVRSSLPNDGAFLIVAESFSGPIALRVAEDRPRGLLGVVLCATFVTSPSVLASLTPLLSRPGLLRNPLIRSVARQALIGSRSPKDLGDAVDAALDAITPEVLSARMRCVSTVDVRRQLVECPVPLMLIVGTADRLVSPAPILKVRPDLPVVRIDAPHLVLQAAPKASAEAIVSFAEKIMAT